MKTYIFRVVVEPDDDRWAAYCPALEKYAAATWGYTKEEALKNIQEVLSLIVEEFVEDGDPIPAAEKMSVSEGAAVTVTV